MRVFENEVKKKTKSMEEIQAMELIADLALIPSKMNTSSLPEYG